MRKPFPKVRTVVLSRRTFNELMMTVVLKTTILWKNNNLDVVKVETFGTHAKSSTHIGPKFWATVWQTMDENANCGTCNGLFIKAYNVFDIRNITL